MNRSEIQFLELLKSGIWGTVPNVDLFKGQVDWVAVMDVAEKQTALALAFDGYSNANDNLDANQKLQMDDLMEWLGQTNYLETENEELNRKVASLVRHLDEVGVRSRLMKGQGCATYYPHPNHRQCGDIDLYVGLDQYERVKELLIEHGVKMDDESEVHGHFDWKGTPLELHRLPSRMYTRSLDRRFQHIVKDWAWVKPRVCNIGGQEVAMFNPTFNCFYIFMHLYEHFLQLGVGLRQICDWALVMDKEQQVIEWDEVRAFVDAVGCKRAWVAFYELAVKHLGLPRIKEMESAFDMGSRGFVDRDVKFLIEDIFEVGNFGKHGDSLKTRKMGEGIKGNLRSYAFLLKRLCKVWRFGRREVIAYPLYKLTHGVKS